MPFHWHLNHRLLIRCSTLQLQPLMPSASQRLSCLIVISYFQSFRPVRGRALSGIRGRKGLKHSTQLHVPQKHPAHARQCAVAGFHSLRLPSALDTVPEADCLYFLVS